LCDVLRLPLSASVIAVANALWTAIQQVPERVELYSDPSQKMELPFPFPGAKMPTDRFDFHTRPPRIRTFTYMGRARFPHILRELPAPPVHVNDAIAATFAASAAAAATAAPTTAAGSAPAVTAPHLVAPPKVPNFFPPIRSDIFQRSIETFVYGTIGWGQLNFSIQPVHAQPPFFFLTLLCMLCLC
jgi:hypothetical protein